MITLTQLIKSLYKHQKHTCCDEAEWYICPPNHSSNGWVELLKGGKGKVEEIKHWHINLDQRSITPILFCPWCGEKLPQ